MPGTRAQVRHGLQASSPCERTSHHHVPMIFPSPSTTKLSFFFTLSLSEYHGSFFSFSFALCFGGGGGRVGQHEGSEAGGGGTKQRRTWELPVPYWITLPPSALSMNTTRSWPVRLVWRGRLLCVTCVCCLASWSWMVLVLR